MRYGPSAMKVLLIEDDISLQTTLTRTLERRGMRVVACMDGARALERWQASDPDIVLLDLSLPGLDGLEVLEQARAQGWRTPVIILTARGTIGDRVLGLKVGADDYLPKPFDLDELDARMHALMRRSGASLPASAHAAVAPTLGRLHVDPESGAVWCQGQVLEMPPRESAFLRTLMQRPGQAVTKERLFAAVFPEEGQVQLEAVEVVAYRLRKRLVDTDVQLVTLRGLGYLLKATP